MKTDKENTDKNQLQKLYSAHVQENLVLHRHKTDLDHAKLKKLRQLNSEEDAFLRKYEKYAEPEAARSRRSSIDASILKVSEVNAAGNQPITDEGVASKSLGRSAINNDCPYSLDTWNNMVDAEKNILDAYKRNILFGENKHKDMADNTTALVKKQTLKPINIQSPTIEFSSEGFDEEIQMVQGGFRKRSNTADSLENGITLSKLRNRRSSTDSNMSAIRLPSIRTNTKVSPRNRRKKTSDSTSPRESSDDDSGNKQDKDAGLSTSTDSYKGILRKPPSPKPVANASVFIHQDPAPVTPARKNRRSSFDISSLIVDENAYLENLRRKTRSPSVSFLPIIPQSPTLINHDSASSVKRSVILPLQDSSKDTTVDSQTDSRRTSTTTSPRIARRSSMTTSTLKLLVDSHHGAAKLRYMERLAVEMEKEETAKLPPEERPVPIKKEETNNGHAFDELRNCRYLRMAGKRGSSESESGDGVLSS